MYFFNSAAADTFEPSGVKGVLKVARTGLTQVQVLTSDFRALEDFSIQHEKVCLERLRLERLEEISAAEAAQGVADAQAQSVTSLGGEYTESGSKPIKKPSKMVKKRGCKGCGK
ncbi:MAG: hypothetical protein JSS66_06095 [Armatimonadetes bacterium]|nr:hypothetical protein [Armatimonadota bacterium]